MTERVPWHHLPAGLRTAVQAHTGAVTSAETVTQGLSCTTALHIETVIHGPLFLKGVRDTDTDGTAALRWEERVNPAVAAGISPSVVHSVQAYGWHCLLFRWVTGRTADLSPGSPDVDAVADAIQRMQHLQAPDCGIPPLADRLAAQLPAQARNLLTEPHLLHTDTNPHNFLISPGGQAYVIDWAMPALGPAWVDAAYTAVRLMEDGHTPDDALTWLEQCASWRNADLAAVNALVGAICRQWETTVGEQAAAPSNRRFRKLLSPRPARLSPQRPAQPT